MRKVLLALVSVLILVISVLAIKHLLDPNENFDFKTTTTRSFKDYTLFNYGDHFNTYVIEGNLFSYDFGDKKVSYVDNVLKINEKKITDVSYVYEYFSIYDDAFLVIGYTKENKNYILNYNFYTKEEKILEEYKGMLVDFKEGLIFEDVGYLVNYSYIKDNKHIKSDESVCDIPKKDDIILKTVEYYYDTNQKFINNTEELFSNNVYGYIQKYSLCK